MTEDVPQIDGRSRRRRNVVGSSPHRDDYVRLMEAGWTSIALERYASFRYEEDIPASTFRAYKRRAKVQVDSDLRAKGWVHVPQLDDGQILDVLGARADLIRLQQRRIGIDHEHENSMTKLFGTTRGEIDLMSKLLDQYKADLQDVGLMGQAGKEVTVRTGAAAEPAPGEAPKARTLGDLIGAQDPEVAAGMARLLHIAAGPSAEQVEGYGATGA